MFRRSSAGTTYCLRSTSKVVSVRRVYAVPTEQTIVNRPNNWALKNGMTLYKNVIPYRDTVLIENLRERKCRMTRRALSTALRLPTRDLMPRNINLLVKKLTRPWET